MESIVIRSMEPGEEQEVCNLVREVFSEFVAPLYEKDGVDEFFRYVDPKLVVERLKSNHFILVAEDVGKLVGVIELRDFNHISLLFVASGFQRRGIARQLLNNALGIARSHNSELTAVSVHSSPNAVDAYESLGFKPEGREKLEHGIRYLLMKLDLCMHDGG